MKQVLALCCAAVVLAGCSGEASDDGAPGDAASASPAPAASSSGADDADDDADDADYADDTAGTTVPSPVPSPEAGLCYRLSLEDAARPTNEADPVACTEKHTARTVHVGRLDTIVEGHALGVDSDRAREQLAETCPAEVDAFLGGDDELRALSRFEAIWFSPTLEQYQAGAMWFRCDVVAVGGPDELLTLPSDQRLEGILDRPGALDTYGLCGTAEPGAEGFERVACARPHSWVAVATIPIQGGEEYPGVDEVREAGDDACSDEVRSRNDFVLEYRYGWEWPTVEQWAAGQRYGFCWAPNDLA